MAIKIRNKNRRKERFWSGSGKFFLTVIIIYLLGYSVYKITNLSAQRTDSYRASDIEVTGNKLVSTTEILSLCGFSKKSEKEVRVNVDSLAAKLIELKYIKGISITRRPPRVLNITVEEFKPVAFIYGRGLNLIDGEGFLIPIPERETQWDLPLITGINQNLGQLGQRCAAQDAHLALEIVRYLEDENPLLAGLISDISMAGKHTIELSLVRGGATIRVNRETFYKELFVLKNYIANYLDWVRLAKIEYIDLRFENQLIVKPKS